MLDEPDSVEADAVGQLALVKGLLVQRVPIDVRALVWTLHLE
jgi:hypothetical protein